MPRRAGPHAPS